MIINQNKISVLSTQKHKSQRYSYRRQPQLMMTTQSINSKTRFFTQRQEEKGFDEYQNGTKIIKDLPEIKLNRLKNKPSLYNHIFNFISTDKYKNQSKIKRKFKVGDQINEDYYISHSPVPQNRSIYTQFLKRKSSDNIQKDGSHQGYSLVIPALEYGEEKTENLRIFKRKSFKHKYEKTPKIKNDKRRIETQKQQPAINQLIRIERMEISGIRYNKSLINKAKIVHIQRKENALNRMTSSRIEPWGIHCNQMDADVF